MNKPLVSVCVPNLNTRSFLEERLQTIQKQTYPNLEIIVSDNFSNDGAWEFFQDVARKDGRVRISQAPREGMYPNWNNCIRRARGKYIYIATSDDTMTADCLEKLVEALEAHPECDIAHCCLTFIDQGGTPISTGHCWENWPTTRFFGNWNARSHTRAPGHDTVVALALGTVFYSITQVLIRRRLFDVIGDFQKQWGSFGDLEWQMRAALSTHVVHVPEYLATWRLHPKQATDGERHRQALLDGRFIQMADEIIRFSRTRGLPGPGGLPTRLRRFCWNECMEGRLASDRSRLARLRLMLRAFPSEPVEVVRYYWERLAARFRRVDLSIPCRVRTELRRLNITGPEISSPGRGIESEVSAP
jgi:glycosyltransferase involved in cell wall biosynthesis